MLFFSFVIYDLTYKKLYCKDNSRPSCSILYCKANKAEHIHLMATSLWWCRRAHFGKSLIPSTIATLNGIDCHSTFWFVCNFCVLFYDCTLHTFACLFLVVTCKANISSWGLSEKINCIKKTLEGPLPLQSFQMHYITLSEDSHSCCSFLSPL